MVTLARSHVETAATHPAISVRGLSHSYGDRVALNDVSLAIKRGEIFAFLGPNGSGKTTLFRILSTLMLPSSGSASILGADVVRAQAIARAQFGIVFQGHSIDRKLTCYENLRHQGHLYGFRGHSLQQRIFEILDRVGLVARATELAETLSGGMQRRLELAKGLIHHPSVLLLDEPSTGLDPGVRSDLWQYLQVLRESEGTTILLTTHLMGEADRCDRLAILNDGNIVAVGTPSELKSEIGGDVVLMEAGDPQSLASRIRSRFSIQSSVLDGKVRCEIKNGHRFAADVVEAFTGEIRSVMVSKPSLEDVFIDRTGHHFWVDERRRT